MKKNNRDEKKQALYLEVLKAFHEKKAFVKTQTLLHCLLNASKAVVYSCKTEPPYPALFVSENIKEMLGYNSHEFIENPNFWSEHLHPQDAPRVFDELQALSKQSYSTLEYRFKTKDGQYKWVYDELKLSHDDQGKPAELIGCLIDITRHKQMEEALRNSEERYRTLFNDSPEGIIIADIQNKRFKYANPAICKLLGYSEEELLKMSVNDIHPQESLAYVFAEFKAQAKGEKILSSNMPYLRKDGTVRYADINAVKVLIDGTKYNMGFFRDITKRKQAEEALKASEEKLREQKLALEKKNVALREVIAQIEVEKDKIKDDIAANITEILLPILKKCKVKTPSNKYIDLIQHYLENLTSSLGRKLIQQNLKLTPREIELCGMIKGGLTNKEISGLLSISHTTVEKHRKNIRQKLGITGKGVNLVSFLQTS